MHTDSKRKRGKGSRVLDFEVTHWRTNGVFIVKSKGGKKDAIRERTSDGLIAHDY